jgi:acetolactate decarboxylase
MKKRLSTFFCLLLLSFPAMAGGALFQVSTIDALLSGIYDGDTNFFELRKHGDFGIGTLNRLDGEMLAVDGVFYQVRADGKVYPVTASQQTPFAVVTFFKPEQEWRLELGQNLGRMEKWLDEKLPSRNLFYAVRVEGEFAVMKTRSIAAQDKPYRPLAEVAKKQAVFDLRNVRGVMVGFRSPAFVKGINVPGYHLHFISEDRTAGGHVLNFVATSAVVKVAAIHDFQMRLPRDQAFATADLGEDREKELNAVEK